MATAIIRSLRNGDPTSALDGVSRNDLIMGDVVSVQYVGTGATTYSWSIVYAPESSTATFSGVSTNPNPGTFTIDKEGSYLVRLVVNAGIAGEDTQYLRLRALTEFGSLHFVAAGERRDATAVIPVDIDPVGWADDQNRNLKTLLDFVKPLVSSGRVLYVDANDGTSNYGDYSSIQDAIDYADAQAPTESAPYVILVRAGLYVEDLTFKPHINLVGWSGNQPEDDKIVRIRAASVSGFSCSLPNIGDETNIVNVHLEGTLATANALVTKTGFGTLGFHFCTITSEVGSIGQGSTIDHQEGDLYLDHSKIVANDGGDDLNFAYKQSGQNTDLFATDCTFHGPSCLEINNLRHNAQGVLANFERCSVISTGGVTSFGVRTGGNCSFDHSFIETNTGKAYSVNPNPPTGNTISGDIIQQLRWSFVDGDIEWDIDETLGANELRLGSVEYGSFVQTGTIASPPYGVTRTALVKGDSVFYDNSTTSIAAENVQDAIDEVHGIASTAVQSASNVGTGLGVFKQKTGTNLEFKSLTSGTDISITPVGDDLQIAYTGLASGVTSIGEDDSSVTVVDNGISNGTITFNIDGTDVWQVDGNGDLTPMADSTYNIGTSSLNVQNIYNTGLTFDTNNSLTGAEGVLTWNGSDGTLDLGLKGGNVTLQIGQETVFRAKNTSTVNMSDGDVVYITGSDGTNVEIGLANAGNATSEKTIGIVTEPINISNKGFVTTQGLVRGLNLDPTIYSDGDIVYLSTTDGGYTNTAPTFPNKKVEIGYVVNAHATQGELYVHVKDIHLENWEEDAAGNFLPLITNTYNIGSASYLVQNIFSSEITTSLVDSPATTDLSLSAAGTVGWTIGATNQDFIPQGTSGTQDIGSATNRVQSIYVDAVSSVHFIHVDGGTTYDWALNVDVTDPTTPVLQFNGATIGAGGNLSDFNNDLTSIDWSIIDNTPTTIAGYGITDAFDGDYSSLANIPTTIVLSDNTIDSQPVRQYYADQTAFPSATDWHGAIAHSHSDGAMYFAHGASWNKIANASDIPTSLTDLGIVDGSANQVLTTDGLGTFSFSSVSSGGIAYGDLSVTTNAASGGGSLSYDDTNGTFTYTPADVSGGGGGGDTIEDTTNAAPARMVAESDAQAGNEYIALTGSIIPITNATYDLGNASNKFRDLYLDGNTIYLGNTQLGNDVDGDFTVDSAKVAKELLASDPIIGADLKRENLLDPLNTTYNPTPTGIDLAFSGSTAVDIEGTFITDVQMRIVDVPDTLYKKDDANRTFTEIGSQGTPDYDRKGLEITLTFDAWDTALGVAPQSVLFSLSSIYNSHMTRASDFGNIEFAISFALDPQVVQNGGTQTFSTVQKVWASTEFGLNVSLVEAGQPPVNKYFYDSYMKLSKMSRKSLLGVALTSDSVFNDNSANFRIDVGVPNNAEVLEFKYSYNEKIYVYKIDYRNDGSSNDTVFTLTSTAATLETPLIETYDANIDFTGMTANQIFSATLDLLSNATNGLAQLDNTTDQQANGVILIDEATTNRFMVAGQTLPPFGPTEFKIVSSPAGWLFTENSVDSDPPSTMITGQGAAAVLEFAPDEPLERETLFEKNIRTPQVTTNRISLRAELEEADSPYNVNDVTIDFQTLGNGATSLGVRAIDFRKNLPAFGFTTSDQDTPKVVKALRNLGSLLLGLDNISRYSTFEFIGFSKEGFGANQVATLSEGVAGFTTNGDSYGFNVTAPMFGYVGSGSAPISGTSTHGNENVVEYIDGDIILNPIGKNKVVHLGQNGTQQIINFNEEIYLEAHQDNFRIGTTPSVTGTQSTLTGLATYEKNTANEELFSVIGNDRRVTINSFVTRELDQEVSGSGEKFRNLERASLLDKGGILTVREPIGTNNNNNRAVGTLASFDREFDTTSATLGDAFSIQQNYNLNLVTVDGNGVKSLDNSTNILAANNSLVTFKVQPTTLGGTETISNSEYRGEYSYTVLDTIGDGATWSQVNILRGNKKKHTMFGGLQLGLVADQVIAGDYSTAASDYGMMGRDANYNPVVLKRQGWVQVGLSKNDTTSNNSEIYPARNGTYIHRGSTADIISVHTNPALTGGGHKYHWDEGDSFTVYNESTQTLTVTFSDNSGYAPTTQNPFEPIINGQLGAMQNSIDIPTSGFAVFILTRVRDPLLADYELFRVVVK